MVVSEGDFVDGQCASNQWLGLRQPVRVLEQQGQVIESYGDGWVVVSEGTLVDAECASHQRLGLGVQTLVEEKAAQLVHQPARRVGDPFLVC